MIAKEYRKIFAAKYDNSVNDAKKLINRFVKDMKSEKFFVRLKIAWDIVRGK